MRKRQLVVPANRQLVVPAKAGTHFSQKQDWAPAFAGATLVAVIPAQAGIHGTPVA